MSILAAIRPKEPLRHLRWFDMLIVTAILFGQFAYRSTQLYIASLMPQVETAAATEEVRDTAVTGVAYSENMSLQLTLLAIALVYLVILTRGLLIAAKAQSLYSRTLAGALTMTFFCYAFVNMGMVSGILPVVGVPLPLVSYGGTATLSIMTVLALLMGISSEHKTKRRYEFNDKADVNVSTKNQ